MCTHAQLAIILHAYMIGKMIILQMFNDFPIFESGAVNMIKKERKRREHWALCSKNVQNECWSDSTNSHLWNTIQNILENTYSRFKVTIVWSLFFDNLLCFQDGRCSDSTNSHFCELVVFSLLYLLNTIQNILQNMWLRFMMTLIWSLIPDSSLCSLLLFYCNSFEILWREKWIAHSEF